MLLIYARSLSLSGIDLMCFVCQADADYYDDMGEAGVSYEEEANDADIDEPQEQDDILGEFCCCCLCVCVCVCVCGVICKCMSILIVYVCVTVICKCMGMLIVCVCM